MDVPSIDHGYSVPDTRVGGLFRACQRSTTVVAFCGPASCSYPVQPFSNTWINAHRACLPPTYVFTIFKIGNIFGWLSPFEIYSSRNIFTRKIKQAKKLITVKPISAV